MPVVWSGGYQARAGDTITAPLLALLESLRPTWRFASGQVARVGLGTDPDATLAGVLGMSPRSETYVGRSVLGPQYNEYYWRFLARPINAAWWTRLGQLSTTGLGTLTTKATPTRLGNSTYLGQHFTIGLMLAGSVASPTAADTVRLPSVDDVAVVQLRVRGTEDDNIDV